MGRQIQFYMLRDDCKAFLDYVQNRDPVVIIRRDSKSPEIFEEHSVWKKGGAFCLWNQSLLTALNRQFVPESKLGPYYTVGDSLPLIELFISIPSEWNGRPALTLGRIYTGWSRDKGNNFVKWFNSLSGWIRRNYVSSPDKFIGGYVGPAALEWFKQGGLLLPMIYPPITPEWLAVFQTQDNIRRLLASKTS